MDRFPALRFILRYGRIGAALIALLSTAWVVHALWPPLGLAALVAVPVVLPLAYYVFKSYVELVQIVTEMVH